MQLKHTLIAISIITAFASSSAIACGNNCGNQPGDTTVTANPAANAGASSAANASPTLTANPMANAGSSSGSNSDAVASANQKQIAEGGTGIGVGVGMGGKGGDGGNAGASAQNSTNVGTSVGVSNSNSARTGDSTSIAGGGSAHADGGNSASFSAGGKSGVEGSGNSDVSIQNVDASQDQTFIPVQVSNLPPTIAYGSLTLQKVRDCGWRETIVPFKRDRQIPILLGLFYTSEAVQTMHGMDMGPDTEKPLEEVKGVVLGKTVTKYMGHVLYLTSGSDGKGGGSSSALNHVNSEAWAGGAGQSANSNLGVVGMVAVPCEYDAGKAGLLVTKTEKQGLVRKEGVTKKDVPAGTKFHYYVPGPVQKTETSQEIPAAVSAK